MRKRVLVGDSVWEWATVTVVVTERGLAHLYVEFDAEDLDSLSIPLDAGRDLERGLRGPSPLTPAPGE